MVVRFFARLGHSDPDTTLPGYAKRASQRGRPALLLVLTVLTAFIVMPTRTGSAQVCPEILGVWDLEYEIGVPSGNQVHIALESDVVVGTLVAGVVRWRLEGAYSDGVWTGSYRLESGASVSTGTFNLAYAPGSPGGRDRLDGEFIDDVIGAVEQLLSRPQGSGTPCTTTTTTIATTTTTTTLSPRADKKQLTVDDLVGPWTGGWKNRKFGTSGDITVDVATPDDETVAAFYSILGNIFGCASSPSGTLTVTKNVDFTDDNVDFSRSSETFGDVHVVRMEKRKVMVASPATCGGLGPAFQAIGKINKKERKGSIKFKLTFPDGQTIKSVASVGKP